MNVPPVAIHVPGTAGLPVPVDTPIAPPPTGKEQDLKTAVRDFVALLYADMFRNMREAGQEEDGEGLFNSFEAQMFMGFFDYDVAQKFADAGGASLSNALYKQLDKTGGAAQQAQGVPVKSRNDPETHAYAGEAELPGSAAGLAPVVEPPPLPELPVSSDHRP